MKKQCTRCLDMIDTSCSHACRPYTYEELTIPQKRFADRCALAGAIRGSQLYWSATVSRLEPVNDIEVEDELELTRMTALRTLAQYGWPKGYMERYEQPSSKEN